MERRGTDAAKAQQVTDQWDVPREEVLRRVDDECQGGLPHDQGHQGQSSMLKGAEIVVAPSGDPFPDHASRGMGG